MVEVLRCEVLQIDLLVTVYSCLFEHATCEVFVLDSHLRTGTRGRANSFLAAFRVLER